MEKSTISMVIFNSYVKLPEGKINGNNGCNEWNQIPAWVQ